MGRHKEIWNALQQKNLNELARVLGLPKAPEQSSGPSLTTAQRYHLHKIEQILDAIIEGLEDIDDVRHCLRRFRRHRLHQILTNAPEAGSHEPTPPKAQQASLAEATQPPTSPIQGASEDKEDKPNPFRPTIDGRPIPRLTLHHVPNPHWQETTETLDQFYSRIERWLHRARITHQALTNTTTENPTNTPASDPTQGGPQ